MSGFLRVRDSAHHAGTLLQVVTLILVILLLAGALSVSFAAEELASFGALSDGSLSPNLINSKAGLPLEQGTPIVFHSFGSQAGNFPSGFTTVPTPLSGPLFSSVTVIVTAHQQAPASLEFDFEVKNGTTGAVITGWNGVMIDSIPLDSVSQSAPVEDHCEGDTAGTTFQITLAPPLNEVSVGPTDDLQLIITPTFMSSPLDICVDWKGFFTTLGLVVERPPNDPPICDANGPYSAECQGTTTILSLDGTGSYDPDGGSLAYTWNTSCPGGSFNDPGIPMPELTVNSSSSEVDCSASLTVTDIEGSSDSCSSTVTVADTSAPALACPADTIIECDQSPEPAVTGSASAIDVCDPNPAVTFSDAIIPGACPEESTITRVWTATDASGNTSSCAQTIEVVDETAPVIQCNASGTITPPDAPISFTATATDNCAGNPSVEIIDYDCFMFVNKLKRVDKTESCVVAVNGNTLTIVDSGGAGDNIAWKVRASDDCGNVAESMCSVMVVRPGLP